MLVAGTALLIMLTPSSSIWLAIAGAAVIGFGFGYANLVFIITTQAAVGWEQRGAVTASNLFMRQLGQAIGTAAFGAVFNLGLYSRIPDASDIVTKMMDPATRTNIPALDVQNYAAAIAASLHAIYLIAVLLAVAVLLLTVALPSKHRAGDPTPP
jgi:Na+/melibiose symporter-like transporter